MNLKVNKKRFAYVYLPVLLLMVVVLSGAGIAALTGPEAFRVAVVLSNTAPVIWFNYTDSNIRETSIVTAGPTEGAVVNLAIRINITDDDGAANIQDSSVKVNITLNRTYYRTNDTGNCELLFTDSGTNQKGYECIIGVHYYDNASSQWKINVTASDNGGSFVYNDTLNATVSSLSAFAMTETDYEVSTTVGSSNQELTIGFNNTGNFNFIVLNITPYALNASLTDFFMLGGGTATPGTANFSINKTPSAGGFGINMVNATPLNITGNNPQDALQLPVKNMHEQFGNSTAYIYIDVPAALTTGVTYNSSRNWDAWAQ